MKRYLSGLSQASASRAESSPDGFFLVRVERAQYRWHAQKPYFLMLFKVLEPETSFGHRFTGRLYCTAKALWKLNWFLLDFAYDAELLERDEVDDKHLVGLSGVVQIRHAVVSGTPLITLGGFAPSSKWEELSATVAGKTAASCDTTKTRAVS
jgi:hypothetical protein